MTQEAENKSWLGDKDHDTISDSPLRGNEWKKHTSRQHKHAHAAKCFRLLQIDNAGIPAFGTIDL